MEVSQQHSQAAPGFWSVLLSAYATHAPPTRMEAGIS